MNRKNSSYYLLFRYALIVVMIVLLITGFIMVSICSAFYRRSQLNDLKSVGELFISCVKEEYNLTGSENSDSVRRLHKSFSEQYDLNIYLYDSEGNCLLSPDDSENGSQIPSNARQKIEDDDYFLELDSTNYSSNGPQTAYGTVFFLKSGVISPVKSYAVIYGDTKNINSFTAKIALFYAVFAILGMYVTYLLLKRRIKKYMNYETDFLRVTEKYTKGDFSEKIPSDLPGALKDIADRVNAIAANVEKSDETSKTFIANVSHELRTPMTTIGGFVDGILDGTIKKTKQNEYLILVSKEIKRLRILISSMLNMTRFESGTLSPNFIETNITDLVIQTVFMFEKKIDDKHLEVEGLGSGRLDAVVDPDLMQQVIYNLVENAVKFVNEGGTLSFRFEQADGMNIIGIKNTGEGLQNSEIQQVFDRFYKTDSSRGKDTTGLGLGLSISRKIVHLHNGHIVVKSVYGEYTEFQVQIPEDPRIPENTNSGKSSKEKG
ncbi:MAG: HAMP domain-containing histidine kinase [Ruminococcus sp.]|nr:HAMP domain-containing histidine kinase [Ruminococcus sp.]